MKWLINNLYNSITRGNQPSIFIDHHSSYSFSDLDLGLCEPCGLDGEYYTVPIVCWKLYSKNYLNLKDAPVVKEHLENVCTPYLRVTPKYLNS